MAEKKVEAKIVETAKEVKLTLNPGETPKLVEDSKHFDKTTSVKGIFANKKSKDFSHAK